MGERYWRKLYLDMQGGAEEPEQEEMPMEGGGDAGGKANGIDE